MKPEVVTGLFTLGGTAVGASLAPVLAGTQESRRMRRAVRTAARLVEVEVEGNLARLTTTAKTGQWATLERYPLAFTEWEDWKGALADWLAPTDWLTVRWGVAHAQLVERRQQLRKSDPSLSSVDVESIADGVKAMQNVALVLDRYAKAPLVSLPRRAARPR